MDFASRYKKLNAPQRQAVDHIDGPLMVVAGPGTGKTELLSMRAAHILQKTDVLPQNILCLTFTESGATAMRQRLTEIIGADAYKVAIHTFHSFGSEIINQNGEFFYSHAHFSPASQLNIYEMLRSIFEHLEHNNPLSSTMNGEYTHLSDTIQVISELKKSGLTSDELLAVLDDNERVLDVCEADLATLFAERIGKKTAEKLAPIAHTVAELALRKLPPGVVSLIDTLALSMSHAVDAAAASNSTKPITAWRNMWLEKNEHGEFVFKDRKRIKKLRSVSFIYYQYLLKMQEQELYDFDDMVLRVVHALEVFDELRFNLQEKYQYIMVDEFQDTNLAQARLLRSLTNNPAHEGAPNIMVVGDDDQAIYSFQGAEISNILQFRDLYETTQLITLKDNYRSVQPILEGARAVITNGSERLETYLPELDKTLTAHRESAAGELDFEAFETIDEERAWIARSVKKQIENDVEPSEIAVLARRHRELIQLLPYFAREGISVNYERRENVLESEVVVQLELLAEIVHALATQQHSEANARLPELLAHPAWNIDPLDVWKLSLRASKERVSWLELMADDPVFSGLQTWLVRQASASLVTPLEPQLDELIGLPKDDEPIFSSPLYGYFFSTDKLESSPHTYIDFLESLRTIRAGLRDHHTMTAPKLADFLEFISLHRELGSVITAVRRSSTDASSQVHLMTAHKSKGLEFNHVHLHGAIDSAWGERVRSRSRSISYPENLPLAPAGDSYDERLRLFFVAMTRARNTLSISYSLASENGSSTLPASFLAEKVVDLKPHAAPHTEQLTTLAETAWYQPFVKTSQTDMKQLLTPVLEQYKLSATHLGTFLDVSRGGPQSFLLNNLLRFPQAMSPNAAYGSAIHRTLQRAHAHLLSTGKRRPVEDLLTDFESNLAEHHLSEKEYEFYVKRGSDNLQRFLQQNYESFTTSQVPELNFSNQQSVLGTARLTGALDVATIDHKAKTINIVDYKTGKPSTSWTGKTDFEKIKLHKYRQQLMFYRLLVEHSRDYGHLMVEQASLQFVEPTPSDAIVDLAIEWSSEELERFSNLVQAVWQSIISLNLPDTSSYSADYKGILAFEDDLLATFFEK